MPRRIFKYPLKDSGVTQLQLPEGFKVLCPGLSDNALVIWAEVNEGARLVSVEFLSRLTGDDAPTNAHYLGTAVRRSSDHSFVMHVYRAI